VNKERILSRLESGIKHFQATVYVPNAEMYRAAAISPQKPHTLMIACADSRVDVELITNSRPGELFVTRNVGNIVPAYGHFGNGVSAVIEYAVTALKVKHIVVCGHSDCGAMKALLKPESTEEMPSVAAWLTHGHSALNVAHSRCAESEISPQHLRCLTEENVLSQLAHLKTHPCVAGALARKELTLSGWVYEIATGDVSIAERGAGSFRSVATRPPR
jgi:carbonic anhydrase